MDEVHLYQKLLTSLAVPSPQLLPEAYSQPLLLDHVAP